MPVLDSLTQRGMVYFEKISEVAPVDSIFLLASSAADLFEQAENWSYYYKCLSWMTFVFYNRKDWGQAVKYATEALDFSEKRFGKMSSEYVFALSNLAVFSDVQGDYLEAIALTKEAVAIEKVTTPENVASISTSYLNLAFYYQNMGDYDEAESYLDETLRLYKGIQAGNDPNEASIYYLLALCAKGKNKLEDAYRYAHQSLDVIDAYQPVPDYLKQNQLDVCHILSAYHQGADHPDSVAFYAQKALAIQSSGTFFNDYRTFEIMGESALKNGQFKMAIPYFEKAVAALRREFENYGRHPAIASCMVKLANAYAQNSQPTMALECLQKALELNTGTFIPQSLLDNPPQGQFTNTAIALEILEAKAALLWGLYNAEKGDTGYLEGIYATFVLLDRLIQQSRHEYMAETAKFYLTGQVVPIYEKAIAAALQLYTISGRQKYQEQAFVFAESNKAVSMLSKMNDWKAKGSGGIPDSLLTKEQQLQLTLNYYREALATEQALKQPDTNKTGRMEKQVFKLKQDIQQLSSHFEKKYPTYFQQKTQTNALSVSQVQEQLLGEEKSIIEYFVGEHHIYSFCMTTNGLQSYTIPRPKNLDSLAFVLRKALSEEPDQATFRKSYSDFSQTAFAFYHLLLEKPLADLPKYVDRLCIVPDDVLHLLPFGLFLRGMPPPGDPDFSWQKLNYLLEDYALHYAFSVNVLLHQPMQNTSGPRRFLGIAPSFGSPVANTSRSCEAGDLPWLQCNISEVNQIAALFAGSQQMTADVSTVAAFEQTAPDYQIIHLATHACIHPSDPMLNKVFFTDDHLTNFDLGNLRLTADLAVLSACNTGTGTLYKGEGVMSLARSFANAGCASLLTSLWSVDDCSTADLMVFFYKNLHAGMPKDVALQQAEIQFLKETPPARRHPYYWGGFVHIGQADALFDDGTGSRWAFMLLGVFVVGVLGFFVWRKNK